MSFRAEFVIAKRRRTESRNLRRFLDSAILRSANDCYARNDRHTYIRCRIISLRKGTLMIRFYIAFFLLIVWQPISALAQPRVLAELFRNVNCGNCQQADDEYTTYMASNPG